MAVEFADAHRIVSPRGASLLFPQQQRGPVAYGVRRRHAFQSHSGMLVFLLKIPRNPHA